MSIELEALKRFYAAINRNDMQVVCKDFDPHILRMEPPGLPTAGSYRGIEAVREHIRAGRGSWAEGSCEPEKFFVKEEKLVVFAYAWVRLKDATDWFGGRFADGFVFQDGRIVEYRSFAERDEALHWAGIDHQASNNPEPMPSLLEQFAAQDATPSARELISDALSERQRNPALERRQFDFNRFSITLDFVNDIVLIEDELNLDPVGGNEHRLPLRTFTSYLTQSS